MNQLTEVKKNDSVIARYYYDHAGLRYKKIDYISSKTTIYAYGQGTEPLYEEIYSNSYSTSTAPIEKISYLNLGSKRIARDGTGGKAYYFTDHLGSTRIVMDSAGNCTYNEYAPFGEDFLTANAERYKFTGKEDDGATGLYYYNARYYDPAVGRFISEDVAKDGMNWWVYCSNNPLRYVDPSGLEIEAVFYVTNLEHYEKGGTTAKGYMDVTNLDTGVNFRINNVKSGGLLGNEPHNSTPAPFGTYDILNLTNTHEILYHRLEAQDGKYGDDKVNFKGQEKKSLIRLHGTGSGSTFGCISIPDDMVTKFVSELDDTTTTTVMVKQKIFWWKKEEQKKYGTLQIIDKTIQED